MALRDQGSGLEIPIEDDRRYVVGKGDSCDIVLADPCVSRLHCVLERHGPSLYVRDVGSRNGTFLDERRIECAEVTAGTVLTLGDTQLMALGPPTRVRTGFDRLVGRDPALRSAVDLARRAAGTECGVLIVGETGTGKELVAQGIHEASRRANGPFVAINCGAIPRELIGSELFGHDKGAFTGATGDRDGLFVQAEQGTLFLDELGELPLDLQPKLLRALAERQVKRVGGNAFEPIDVRVLAATRRDLGVEMNAGRFRSDLFFRIAQVRVEMPALRERLGDLPLLVEEICKRVGKPEAAPVVEGWIDQRLGNYDWPGNVRELVNVAQVAATLADTPEAIDDVLTLARDSVADQPQRPQTAFAEAKRGAIAGFESDYFAQLSRVAKGNVSEMARQSGMERHHVRAYLRKYGIEKG